MSVWFGIIAPFLAWQSFITIYLILIYTFCIYRLIYTSVVLVCVYTYLVIFQVIENKWPDSSTFDKTITSGSIWQQWKVIFQRGKKEQSMSKWETTRFSLSDFPSCSLSIWKDLFWSFPSERILFLIYMLIIIFGQWWRRYAPGVFGGD